MRLIDADATPSTGISNFSVMFQKVIDGMPTVDLWHYPSKGEYPTEGEDVLCKLPYNHYAVDKYNTQFKYFDFEDTRFTPINIECWQYIIPPKEEA